MFLVLMLIFKLLLLSTLTSGSPSFSLCIYHITQKSLWCHNAFCILFQAVIPVLWELKNKCCLLIIMTVHATLYFDFYFNEVCSFSTSLTWYYSSKTELMSQVFIHFQKPNCLNTLWIGKIIIDYCASFIWSGTADKVSKSCCFLQYWFKVTWVKCWWGLLWRDYLIWLIYIVQPLLGG